MKFMGEKICQAGFVTAFIMILAILLPEAYYNGIDGIWLEGQSACAVSEEDGGRDQERFVRVAAPTTGPGGNADRLFFGLPTHAIDRDMNVNDIDWRHAYDISADAQGNCALALPPGAGLMASSTLLMTPSGDFIALELAEPHEGGDLVIDGAVNKTEPPVTGLYRAGEPGPRVLWLSLPIAAGMPLSMMIAVIFYSLSITGVWWESAAQFTDRLRRATIALSAIMLSGLALQLAFTFILGWDLGGIDGYRHAVFWPVRGGFTEFVTSFGFTVVAAAAIMYARFLLPG